MNQTVLFLRYYCPSFSLHTDLFGSLLCLVSYWIMSVYFHGFWGYILENLYTHGCDQRIYKGEFKIPHPLQPSLEVRILLFHMYFASPLPPGF